MTKKLFTVFLLYIACCAVTFAESAPIEREEIDSYLLRQWMDFKCPNFADLDAALAPRLPCLISIEYDQSSDTILYTFALPHGGKMLEANTGDDEIIQENMLKHLDFILENMGLTEEITLKNYASGGLYTAIPTFISPPNIRYIEIAEFARQRSAVALIAFGDNYSATIIRTKENEGAFTIREKPVLPAALIRELKKNKAR